MEKNNILSAKQWITALERPDASLREQLHDVYGTKQAPVRIDRLRHVIHAFLTRFGNYPIRIFRSPGRINLRGMHVDTHGGYLNLMTHQREVVAVVAEQEDPLLTFANCNSRFSDVSLPIPDNAHETDWMTFLARPDIRESVAAESGHWKNYIRGCACRVRSLFPENHFPGLMAMIDSDIPTGAALSSSAALCTVLVSAMTALVGGSLDAASLIQAARDAEWFTGLRCGVSDQTAMILAGRNELVNVAILPSRFSLANARKMRFPDAVKVLVIQSYTERSLSGAQRVAYTRNRFAYSLALDIVRQEMCYHGVPEEIAGEIKSLADLSPARFEQKQDILSLDALLQCVPEALPLDALRSRYSLPQLDSLLEQYFGTVEPGQYPEAIALRGPLLFGIAESERARIFFDLLQQGDYEMAGRLMSTGHDGDRQRAPDGSPWQVDMSDAALRDLSESGVPIYLRSGAYGASSPALDALVDAACAGGALGASLTGAGLAGTVVALCLPDAVASVRESVCACLRSPRYLELSKRETPLTGKQLDEAVVVNDAPAASGELALFKVGK